VSDAGPPQGANRPPGGRAAAKPQAWGDHTISSVATPAVTDTQGMNYLVSLPRRLVTVWLPLTVFLIVLLFPFY
jgi:hypothetical protein